MGKTFFHFLSTAIAIVLLAVSPSAYADIDSIEVRVLPESIVYGEYYSLGDVAELDGFDVETIQKLARLQIGKSPLPGHSHVISHGQIKRQVRREFPPDKIKFILPQRPIVSRASIKIERKQLEEIALKEIRSHYQDYEEVKIAIKSQLKDEYIPKGNASYEMKRIGNTLRVGGYSSWYLTLLLNQKEVKKILIRAKVDVFDQVMIAKDRIPKGQKISPVDLVPQKKNISKERAGYQPSPDLVIGQHARRDILKSESVKPKLVGLPVIVEKGSAVKLVYKTPNLYLTNIVKAMKSGKKGDVIPVRPLTGNKVIYAVIMDSKNVEVAL